MAFTEINGHRINYNAAGRGEPLVFLHNGFYSSITWENVRQKLSGRFTVIDYDRLGYGKSDNFTGNVDFDIIEHGVDELDGLLDFLDIEECSICGHCLGGAIGVKYAVKHPGRVKKLVCESTGFHSDHRLLVKSDYTFQKFENIDPGLREKLVNMHGAVYAGIFWEILREYRMTYIMNKDYSILDDMKNIRCPVFIINGDRDFYFEVEHQLRAFKKTKNSRLCILPGTGHDPHVESEEAFIFHLTKFLEHEEFPNV